MAQVIFDISVIGNDPIELLYLAGGDPSASTYDAATLTLTNTTVTQVALNQALLDLAAGIPSLVKTETTNAAVEDTVPLTTFALAILGDAAAIATLQGMVSQTAVTQAATLPATPPTGGGGTQLQENFTAVLPPSLLDDSAAGYAVGSRWLDTVSGLLYICTSSVVGLAVWENFAAKVSVSTVTTNTTLIGATQQHIRVNATLAAITVTLPDSVAMVGTTITIGKIDSTQNSVIIAAPIGQFIFGVPANTTGTLILPPLQAQFSSITLRSIGVGWDIV